MSFRLRLPSRSRTDTLGRGAARCTAVASTKRILVVDDDPAICELMVDVLGDEGWSVTTACNGAEALSEMRAHPHDLVLLDLMMPVMDGWAVLAARQTDADLRAVPVLTMSAGGSFCMDRARSLGASGCMPKPFDLDKILAALEAMRTLAGSSES